MSSRHSLAERPMWDYLLGTLDAEASALLEKRYFTDREVFLRLQATELALIEYYFMGALRVSDRRLFEARYLTDPKLRCRLEEVRLRKSYQWPSESRTGTRWIWELAVGGAVVIGLALWVFSPVRPLTPPALRNAPWVPALQIFPIDLFPYSPKGGGSSQQVFELPSVPGILRMNLQFPAQHTPLAVTAQVLLAAEHGERPVVWDSERPLEARSAAGGLTATVEVPTSLLHRGDYIVEAGDRVHDIEETYILHIRDAKP